MTQAVKETEVLTGVVLRAFPVNKRGKFSIYDFVLKTGDGKELKVARFATPVSDLLGEQVSFNASYNSEYNKFTVVGDVNVDGDSGSVVPETTTTAVEEPKRRGRKPRTEETVSAKVEHTDSGREAYRAEAVKGTELDIRSAIEIAKNLNLTYTLSDLVALADRVGRTMSAIAADKGKDRRMAAFRG